VSRVVLAMSGGVDSSVAALLLREQGHEVIGLFMRTGVHAPEDRRAQNKKGCCSALDAGDARRVADRLDIPFYALDFEQDFHAIIDYFADEYLRGRTPNPCVVCNSWLKFGQLWNYAHHLQADFIATGHYARIVAGPAGPELHRAVDPNKDQSYVLYGIRREIVSRLLFPLGGYHKDTVRDLARASGLGVADKPDSVEICFVPDNDHAAVIRQHRPGLDTSGPILDTEGELLGTHDGIEQFTIGQRKGLGVASAARRYVLKIVPETNAVVVGEREDLLANGLRTGPINWLVTPPAEPLDCHVKIRYRHPPAPAHVVPAADGTATVTFTEPQTAVTPGQAAVFYTDTQVLGGGWIEEAT
jgi:tRNA-specific 2-thiouridylase